MALTFSVYLISVYYDCLDVKEKIKSLLISIIYWEGWTKLPNGRRIIQATSHWLTFI